MSLVVQPSLDSTQLIVNVMAKIKTLAKYYSSNAKSTELSSFCRKGTSIKWIQDDEQREPASCQEIDRTSADRGGLLPGPPLWEKNNVQAQLQMLEDEEYEQRERRTRNL